MRPTDKSSPVGYEFLPDHEAVTCMLPDGARRYLAPEDALRAIAATPGCVPVAIDPAESGRIYWADLGDRPFEEWQFLYTLKQAVAKDDVYAFNTDMKILETDAVIHDSAPVRGLIFHISRCGSTLLGKCLAKVPEYLVINQGGPLQRGFWAWATSDFQQSLQPTDRHQIMFQRLVAAMTRRRRPTLKMSFIKFISWNVRYIDFIRSAFPGIPSVFLYRDPVEVIASVVKETTAVLQAKGTAQAEFLTDLPATDTDRITDIQYLALCYARYFQAVRNATDSGLSVLNYRDLHSDNLRDILKQGLHLDLSTHQLNLMRQQFRVHSKDDTKQIVFVNDKKAKQDAVSATDRKTIQQELGALYQAMNADSSNLCHVLSAASASKA